MTVKLYNGKWQDTLKDVELPERRNCHVICDPPYSAKTHNGRRSMADADNSNINYDPITQNNIDEFFNFWSEKVFWILIFTDHYGFYLWEDAAEKNNRIIFAPVIWLKPNATPRFCGDGPQSSCEYICVSRPKIETRCGSISGYYINNIGNFGFVGSKPLNLMRALIRDYTKPGDLIIDPYSGTGTTLIAAGMENRNAIGSEMDPNTYKRAQKRIDAGWNRPLFDEASHLPSQNILTNRNGVDYE